jgi:hypothetical protein
MGWATFWAIASQTHLATAIASFVMLLIKTQFRTPAIHLPAHTFPAVVFLCHLFSNGIVTLPTWVKFTKEGTLMSEWG